MFLMMNSFHIILTFTVDRFKDDCLRLSTVFLQPCYLYGKAYQIKWLKRWLWQKDPLIPGLLEHMSTKELFKCIRSNISYSQKPFSKFLKELIQTHWRQWKIFWEMPMAHKISLYLHPVRSYDITVMTFSPSEIS